MPYACAVNGGRLFVEPSPERSYAIVGRHDEESFDICSPYNPSRCRTWQLHRFEIECDGGRVPWLSVVDAAPHARGRQLWIENGRLHLKSGPGRFNERGRPCFGLPWRGPGERLEAFPGFGDCDSYRRRDRAVTVLPAGFAPLMQLGARIVPAPLPPFRLEEPLRQVGPQMAVPQVLPRQEMAAGEKPAHPQRSGPDERPSVSTSTSNAAPAKGPAPAQRAPDATADAKPRAIAPRVPAEGPTTSGTKPDAQKSAENPKPRETSKPVESAKPDGPWQTSTKVDGKPAQTSSAPPAREDSSTPDRDIASVLIATLHRHAPILAPVFAAMLALSLALIAWRLLRRASQLGPPTTAAAETAADKEPVWPDLGGISAPAPTRAAVEDLIRNADDFYVHVVQLTGRMQGGDALRDVVTDELAAIQASLRAPDLAQAYAAQDWTRLRQGAVQALTDLERIRRIVQSASETAVASAPGSLERIGRPVPTTRDEALAVLGVNAEASDKVIKKIVDAMRQNWHPDLARDDTDRRAREERMKQINIAWDILRPKRQAA